MANLYFLAHRRGQPLLSGASLLPNPRSRGALLALSVEEARLNREAWALREVDRPEGALTEKSHR